MTLLDTLKSMRSHRTAKRARFELRYNPPGMHPVTVGHLDFDGESWTFRYDDEYKQRADLRPVEGFDDVEKIYHSKFLFPFFAVRIPDADRRDIKERLAEDHISNPDPSDLLRLFGRHVVSSPAFELVPAEAASSMAR